MLEIIHFDEVRVLGMRIGEKITDDDMQLLIETAEMKLAALGAGGRLRIYVEVDSFRGIGLDALIKDLKFGLSHFRDFECKAVVSDKAWMARMAKVCDPLFPSIELRHFSTEDRGAARAWVSGRSA